MSAQLLVNSQTSKYNVPAASANAVSSAAELKLNLRTTSPPYLASNVAGSWEVIGPDEVGFSYAGWVTVGGAPNSFWIAVSRNHVNLGNVLCDLCD